TPPSHLRSADSRTTRREAGESCRPALSLGVAGSTAAKRHRLLFERGSNFASSVGAEVISGAHSHTRAVRPRQVEGAGVVSDFVLLVECRSEPRHEVPAVEDAAGFGGRKGNRTLE